MKIVFHGQNAAAFEPGFPSLLAPFHLDEVSTIVVLPDQVDEPEHVAAFRSADVIVGIKLDQTHPKPAALRLYQAPAAGVDGIDRSLLPPGTPLCCCFGHELAIAEYVMAALLVPHVPLQRADADLRRGRWTYWAGDPLAARSELGDSSLGILGFGHIGRAVAERAKAFGMHVTVANRSPVTPGAVVDQVFGLDQLDAFMGSADSIVVCLPLNADTRGLIGAAALAAMRPDARIINVGRGPVIDEQALFSALQQRRIGGAVIDTWYQYPSSQQPNPHPSNLPFHTLDNCLLTPHMSGWTRGTIRRRQQTIADNIHRLATGLPLLNRL